MTRQHEDVATAIATVKTAAAALTHGASDAATQRTVAALDALGVLLPHLREEETDAMPIVSRLITAAEWQAIEKKHNLNPESMTDRLGGSLAHRRRQRGRPLDGARARPPAGAVRPAARLRPAISPPCGRLLERHQPATMAGAGWTTP
jgi:hypothetical protein